jgi:hypothetical protein
VALGFLLEPTFWVGLFTGHKPLWAWLEAGSCIPSSLNIQDSCLGISSSSPTTTDNFATSKALHKYHCPLGEMVLPVVLRCPLGMIEVFKYALKELE